MSGRDDKFRNDPRTTDELIGLALAKDMDADDEEYWHPIHSLQFRLTSILERMEALLTSEDAKSREVAATILGQNLLSAKWEVARCADTVMAAMECETMTEPLASMLHALGHLRDERCIPAILRFLQHPEADVRFAVTNALGGSENGRALAAQIDLSADADHDVRNWATFYLGAIIDTDTPAIREALVARLNDTDDEIQGEAIVGLTRRGDTRVIPMLMKILDAYPSAVVRDWILMQESVEAIAESVGKEPDLAWAPVLQRFLALGMGETKKIQAVLQLCEIHHR